MDSENIPDKGNERGKSLRLLRPSIVVLCGPAACGKSTFAQQHFRPTQIVSSDWARAHVCDDERDQRFNTQAFALVHFVVEQRLTANRLCVVDSTALTPQARKELLDLAKKFQVPTTLMLFNAPLETCIERDEKRARSVGKVIVERQYRAFEQTKATIGQEGFDQVVDFQDGDLEKVQIEILFRPVVRPAQRSDAGTPRRLERSAQPSRLRPTGPGKNAHSVTTASVPPVARPAIAPRPTTPSGSVSTPKMATQRPVEALAPVATPQIPTAAHPPDSPAVPNDPIEVPQEGASAKPAPSVVPRPVPAGAETSSGS
ncbi:MAG: AAA family ATPase [Terriglobia bacterium]|jgi:protein phosphatase